MAEGCRAKLLRELGVERTGPCPDVQHRYVRLIIETFLGRGSANDLDLPVSYPVKLVVHVYRRVRVAWIHLDLVSKL